MFSMKVWRTQYMIQWKSEEHNISSQWKSEEHNIWFYESLKNTIYVLNESLNKIIYDSMKVWRTQYMILWKSEEHNIWFYKRLKNTIYVLNESLRNTIYESMKVWKTQYMFSMKAWRTQYTFSMKDWRTQYMFSMKVCWRTQYTTRWKYEEQNICSQRKSQEHNLWVYESLKNTI